MKIDRAWYVEQLYPLQDEVLQILGGLDTGFYLSGGTAASRGYLHHRFSDDLDLFVNDEKEFGLCGASAAAWDCRWTPPWRTRPARLRASFPPT